MLFLKQLLQQDDFGFPAVKTQIFIICHLIYGTSWGFFLFVQML